MKRKSAQPFVWGLNDCALFCADVYGEMYGKDFAVGIRGTYDDEYHGMRKITALGGWDTILTSRGFVKINKNMASRGDVVICKGMGIWVGTYAIFAGGATRSREELTDAYKFTGIKD